MVAPIKAGPTPLPRHTLSPFPTMLWGSRVHACPRASGDFLVAEAQLPLHSGRRKPWWPRAGPPGPVLGVPVTSDLAVERARLTQRRRSRPVQTGRLGGGAPGQVAVTQGSRGPLFGRKGLACLRAGAGRLSAEVGPHPGRRLVFSVRDTEAQRGLLATQVS